MSTDEQKQFECSACEKRYTIDELAPLNECYWSNVEPHPGLVVPDGQCPDPECGMSCFWVDTAKEALLREAKRALLWLERLEQVAPEHDNPGLLGYLRKAISKAEGGGA